MTAYVLCWLLVLGWMVTPACALKVTLVKDAVEPLDVGDTLDVDVVFDTEGFDATYIELRLLASQSGVLQANGITYNGSIWDTNTGPGGGALDFKPLPHMLDPRSNPLGCVPLMFVWSGNATVATIHLEVLTLPPTGSLELSPVDGHIFLDFLLADFWPNATKEGTTLTFVPEPWSAALLLLAVPWLLRRRRG